MKKNFISELKKQALKNNSIVSVGMDPVIEKIPVKGKNTEVRIVSFYRQIVNGMISESQTPASFKPNYAFFAQYGFEGLRALKKLIDFLHEKKFHVIFDGKRNDIGSTAEAYAKECFDFWKADSITINPLFGFDGVKPFLEKAHKMGKGVYILNKTSNPSSGELQDLKTGKTNFYITLSQNLIKWSSAYPSTAGAVVGATHPKELNEISKVLSTKNIPLLVPGVGAQGGSMEETVRVLSRNYSDLNIHRINSSRGISFAFQKSGSDDFTGEAVKALKKMNDEANRFL